MWFKAVELLGSLSLLIVLHELGHFLAAKYFKVRVEKFYLFFDFMFPMPNVLNFSLFKKKIGDTEYGIGWFPMGGYVQMSGIMDETMDKDALAKPAQAHEFRAKPAWQRLVILLGGIIVNVLLAMVIYTGMSYTWGDEYLPNENAIYGIAVDSLGTSMGLQDGDKITHVDGVEVENFNDIRMTMILDLAENITVKRARKIFKIEGLDDGFYAKILNKQGRMFDLNVPPVMSVFPSKSLIKEAGAQEGDKILAINNVKVASQNKVAEIKETLGNQTVAVLIEREGQTKELTITFDETPMLGYSVDANSLFTFERTNYTVGQAIVAGPVKTWKTFTDYLKQFKLIFNKKIKGYKQVGGFAAIGGMFPAKELFTWEKFWSLTAFLSIMLAFLNLLPIPGLDGGHSVFVLYEMVVGKPANEKFMEYTQMVGMALLFALLIYANGNDIYKAVFG